jgi:hypothetical protein
MPQSRKKTALSYQHSALSFLIKQLSAISIQFSANSIRFLKLRSYLIKIVGVIMYCGFELS